MTHKNNNIEKKKEKIMKDSYTIEQKIEIIEEEYARNTDEILDIDKFVQDYCKFKKKKIKTNWR